MKQGRQCAALHAYLTEEDKARVDGEVSRAFHLMGIQRRTKEGAPSRASPSAVVNMQQD